MDKLLTCIQNVTRSLVHFSTLPFFLSRIEGLVSSTQFSEVEKELWKNSTCSHFHKFYELHFRNFLISIF